MKRDTLQAFTFYASEDKLTNRGNKAGKTIGVEAINRAAAKLAKEVKHCHQLLCRDGAL